MLAYALQDILKQGPAAGYVLVNVQLDVLYFLGLNVLLMFCAVLVFPFSRVGLDYLGIVRVQGKPFQVAELVTKLGEFF